MCSPGRSTEKVRRWNHHTLTTYGIGADVEPQRMGGHRSGTSPAKDISGSQAASSPSWRSTPAGLSALRSRTIIMLSTPDGATQKQSPHRDAPERSNATKPSLVDCARSANGWPTSVASLPTSSLATQRYARWRADTRQQERPCEGIFGVGQRKLQEFGNAFAAEIAAHLQVHPRVEFAARD